MLTINWMWDLLFVKGTGSCKHLLQVDNSKKVLKSRKEVHYFNGKKLLIMQNSVHNKITYDIRQNCVKMSTRVQTSFLVLSWLHKGSIMIVEIPISLLAMVNLFKYKLDDQIQRSSHVL